MEWLSLSNAAYMLVIILGAAGTLVAVKYKPLVTEVKQVAQKYHDAKKDGKISKSEFDKRMGAAMEKHMVKKAKGGVIKASIGTMALKKPTAGQVGLKKLPTPVRNKMGYMNKGGAIKKKKK